MGGLEQGHGDSPCRPDGDDAPSVMPGRSAAPQAQIHPRAVAPAHAWVVGCASPLPMSSDDDVLAAIREHWTAEIDGVEHLPGRLRRPPLVGVGARAGRLLRDARPLSARTTTRTRSRRRTPRRRALMFPLDFVVAPVPSTARRPDRRRSPAARCRRRPGSTGEQPRAGRPGGVPACCVACTPSRRPPGSRSGRRSRRHRCPTTSPSSCAARGTPVPTASGPVGAPRAARRDRRVVRGLPRPGRAGATQGRGWSPTASPHERNLMVTVGTGRCSSTGRPPASRPPSATGARSSSADCRPTASTRRCSTCSTSSGGSTRSASTPRGSPLPTPAPPATGSRWAGCSTS